MSESKSLFFPDLRAVLEQGPGPQCARRALRSTNLSSGKRSCKACMPRKVSVDCGPSVFSWATGTPSSSQSDSAVLKASPQSFVANSRKSSS